MLVHRWVKDALPGSGETAALMSFRIISIGAGVLHAATIAWLAPIIVGHRKQGWLFALGMMTGGYALLHFGYVENYSLFGLAVAVYTYLGILVSMQRIKRWWIIPAFAATVFLHALGLVLFPVTLYVLVADTTLSKRSSELGAWAKLLLLVFGALILSGVMYVALERNLFLRFALVPLGASQQVLDGYSMFSPGHIADWANLLFLLMPSILVVAVTIMRRNVRSLARDARIRFLGIATVMGLAAAFAFEAKIGMPRDWDLFSFAGYPLLALSLVSISSSIDRPYANRIILIMIGIASLCLVPRVITANSPALGIQQFHDYAAIDIRKNRSGMYILQNYYLERADPLANTVHELANERFPEDALYQRAMRAFQGSEYDSAMQMASDALKLNPRMAALWSMVGGIYMRQGMYDRALEPMEICNALNPDATGVLTNLGRVYFHLERYDDAESAFLGAIEKDPGYAPPVHELVRVYEKSKDHEKYMFWLDKAVYQKGARGEWAVTLGEEHLKKSDFSNAARALRHALEMGADSARISQLILTHRELEPYMQR
jgi:Tfp pilus assembly protein PilF